MFDVKTIAIATLRVSRKGITNRLDAVHAAIDDCIDNDGSDRRFDRLIGKRNALCAELSLSEQLERSIESARPEALALLVQ
jgi:hypothetical protein